MGRADDYAGRHVGAIAQDVRQSEIEGQVHDLLNTAEILEKCVAVLLNRIEKVTTSEPKSEGKNPVPCQVMNTILGRLDSINGRIQSSISTLQSTIQRIEL